MRRFFLLISIFYTAIVTQAQELNCQVSIVSQQVQGTVEKQIFDQLQKSIYEFMNNTKWTKDLYTTEERIDCSIMINVTSKIADGEYSGTIQIQSRRPIYKSSYSAPVFNYIDEKFSFKFLQFQQLQFNINSFENNLTSVLAFYAYIILAHDYDAYSNLGGQEYYQKAQMIVANAQSASELGWKSSEGNKNRYWITENALQPVFQGIRECEYKYHRLGLDIMYDKATDGRKVILESLDLLKKVYNDRPASFAMELFFDAKVDELVNVFSKALPEEKTKALETLTTIDPANTNKYYKIQGN